MQRLARAGRLTEQQRMLFAPTRPVMELYDLQNDPGEWNNLIDDAAHANVRRELLGRLGRWMHETLDYLPPAGPVSGEPAGRSWPVSL